MSTFSIALDEIKRGHLVARSGWNGKGMWVGLYKPEVDVDLPYLYMKTVQDKNVPWLASQTDILADDWFTLNRKDVMGEDD
jgi:hypothetical protein